jgi:hypothetical protein
MASLYHFNCAICKIEFNIDFEGLVQEEIYKHFHNTELILVEKKEELERFERRGDLHIVCQYCRFEFCLKGRKLTDEDISILTTHSCEKRERILLEENEREQDRLDRDEIMNDYRTI